MLMAKKIESKYLTMEQAANYCKLSYEAFRYYIKIKRGPQITHIGKKKYFTIDDLKAWERVDKRKNNNPQKYHRTKRKYED